MDPPTLRIPTLRILAVDAFHGGSHRQFLSGVQKHSRHDWTVVAGKPVHWKWRMRSAPLELADRAAQSIVQHGYPDVVFCTDMLDLAQWRGLIRDPRITNTPTVIYFHENQWTYPVSPNARPDSHFGYTNLVSALAADTCWFNSNFHRDDFLDSSKSFVDRMPDARSCHDLDRLSRNSKVLPPGFDPPDSVTHVSQNREAPTKPLNLGWVSRWEYDKRPDGLLELCRSLKRRGIDFQLTLLGQRPKATPAALVKLRAEFAGCILHDGYAETIDAYWSLLSQLDVVFSSADHEFFGIAVCEAIWAGAVPVFPCRLSYVELVPPNHLYKTIEDAAEMIIELQDTELRSLRNAVCRNKIAPLQAKIAVGAIDDAITEIR